MVRHLAMGVILEHARGRLVGERFGVGLIEKVPGAAVLVKSRFEGGQVRGQGMCTGRVQRFNRRDVRQWPPRYGKYIVAAFIGWPEDALTVVRRFFTGGFSKGEAFRERDFRMRRLRGESPRGTVRRSTCRLRRENHTLAKRAPDPVAQVLFSQSDFAAAFAARNIHNGHQHLRVSATSHSKLRVCRCPTERPTG